MSKKKKDKKTISSREIMESVRIPIPLKPTVVISPKKKYSRKDKSWKKEIDY